MLLDLLTTGATREFLISFLLFLPVMLISLPLHEVAHGWMADKMGDHTARNFGRLTLNPLKHLDPMGSLCMLVFGFGWAKPVPINTRNFDKPRKGMALTALAGPMANLLLCFICVLLEHLFALLFTVIGVATVQVFYVMQAFLTFWYLMAYYNAVLCVFNLIPIPPLDGSRIVGLLLPARWYWKVMQYERYVMYGFLILVFVLSRFGISLVGYPAGALVSLFEWLFLAIGL